MTHLLNDQTAHSKQLKWVHSLTAGIDAYTPALEFINSPLPLTNVKGAFSAVLGEFIALGMLFHAKHVPFFQ
jgi:phosphoglycerate dehydrogenase-like enzyme